MICHHVYRLFSAVFFGNNLLVFRICRLLDSQSLIVKLSRLLIVDICIYKFYDKRELLMKAI